MKTTLMLLFFLLFSVQSYAQPGFSQNPNGNLTLSRCEFTAVGDLNSDGLADLIAVTNFDFDEEHDNMINVFYQNAAGWMHPAVRFPYPFSRASAVFAGQFTDDQRTDLLVYAGREVLHIFPQLANGEMGRDPIELTLPIRPSGVRNIKMHDIDQDSRPDLVLLSNDSLHIFYQLTAGAFTKQSIVVEEVYLQDLLLIDFEGDGKITIIGFTNTAHTVLLHQAQAEGSWTQEITNICDLFDLNQYCLASGITKFVTDYDSDGQDELLVTYRESGKKDSIAALGYQGGWVIEQTWLRENNVDWSFSYDMNCDGRNEYLRSDEDRISVINYDPAAGFQVVSHIPTLYRFGSGTPMTVGDFNNDDLPDVAFPVSNLGTAVILYNQSRPYQGDYQVLETVATKRTFTDTLRERRYLVESATDIEPGCELITLDSFLITTTFTRQRVVSDSVFYRRGVMCNFTFEDTLTSTYESLLPPISTVDTLFWSSTQDTAQSIDYQLLSVSLDTLSEYQIKDSIIQVTIDTVFQDHLLSITKDSLLIQRTESRREIHTDSTFVRTLVTCDNLIREDTLIRQTMTALPNWSVADTFLLHRQRIDKNRYPAGITQLGGSAILEFEDHRDTEMVAVGDLNDDGLDDLAVVYLNLAGGDHIHRVHVFFQTEEHQLLQAYAYPIEATISTDGIVIADLDHNGLNDIILATSQIQVIYQSEAGVLNPPVSLLDNYRLTGIQVADMNNDNRNDILYSLSGNARIGALLQAENGTWQDRQLLSVPAITRDLKVYDINNDQLNDILGTTHSIVTFHQLDTGYFVQPEYYIHPDIHSIELADLNGDGKDDLIGLLGHNFYNNPKEGMYAWWGTSDDFAKTPQLLAPIYDADALEVIDLNCDGQPELLTVVYKNLLVVHWQPGQGEPKIEMVPILQSGTAKADIHGLATGDLNGDRRPDVAIANQFDKAHVLYNTSRPPAMSFVEVDRRQRSEEISEIQISEKTLGTTLVKTTAELTYQLDSTWSVMQATICAGVITDTLLTSSKSLTQIQFTYDSLTATRPVQQEIADFRVFPNPTDGSTLSLSSSELVPGSGYQVFLRDYLGRELASFQGRSSGETIQLQLPSTVRQSGMFLVELSVGDRIGHERVVIDR